MTKSQHTQGNWTYEDTMDGCCWNIGCTSHGCHESHPTGIYVVDGPEFDAENSSSYGLCFRSEADARLIAAAPELLAALETLLKSYDEETTGVFLHGEHAARIAISKAKGGAE